VRQREREKVGERYREREGRREGGWEREGERRGGRDTRETEVNARERKSQRAEGGGRGEGQGAAIPSGLRVLDQHTRVASARSPSPRPRSAAAGCGRRAQMEDAIEELLLGVGGGDTSIAKMARLAAAFGDTGGNGAELLAPLAKLRGSNRERALHRWCARQDWRRLLPREIYAFTMSKRGGDSQHWCPSASDAAPHTVCDPLLQSHGMCSGFDRPGGSGGGAGRGVAGARAGEAGHTGAGSGAERQAGAEG
jgi:hypothetical protein